MPWTKKRTAAELRSCVIDETGSKPAASGVETYRVCAEQHQVMTEDAAPDDCRENPCSSLGDDASACHECQAHVQSRLQLLQKSVPITKLW